MLCRTIADMEVVTKIETPRVRSCPHARLRSAANLLASCSRFPAHPTLRLLFPIVTLAIRAGLTEQIERDFKMSCMSLQIGQTKPVTQALIPAASFSQVRACGHTATGPLVVTHC